MCPSPVANRVNPDNFSRKWVRNVVLQKSAVEISQARSAILKQCAVDVFRSVHQYLRSAHWSFNLEALSDKSEVCTDLSEVPTDRYQRSVDFWELHTDLWEVRTDNDIWELHTGLWEVCTQIQEGRSDV